MRRALLLALGALWLSVGAPAYAQDGGFRISPVIITVPAERGTASFRLHNGRGRETAFEIQAYAWSQASGVDTLTPTQALIIAPSVFLTPAGGEQIVRIGAPQQRGQSGETSYRLIVRELPSGAAPRNGFRLLVEMSLPVFVRARAARAAFAVQRAQTPDGAPAIAFVNTGDAHAALSAPPDTLAFIDNMPRYLLPGAHLVRRLTADAARVDLIAADPSDVAPQLQTFELGDAPRLADVR